MGSSDKTILELRNEDHINKKDIFSKDNLKIVKEGMEKTITEGSGYSVFGDNFITSVAGKTGTAQFGNEDKTHAWFTCFAPYEDPRLVITVLIEAGGEGYESAAPLAKDILENYFSESS
jgi:cell division protein FtsI/penicillin-binding protein 2